MRLAVADTGPLHYFLLIGEIEIIAALVDDVVIPPEVHDELNHPRTPAAVRAWIAAPPVWLRVQSSPGTDTERGLARLDPSERAAITLAASVRADAVFMDDRAGVAAARARGLEAFGTLGLLQRAAAWSTCRARLRGSSRPTFTSARSCSTLCSPSLEQTGEGWPRHRLPAFARPHCGRPSHRWRHSDPTRIVQTTVTIPSLSGAGSGAICDGMQTAPRRLKAKRLQLIPRVDGGVQDLPWPGSLVPTRASILRRVRAIRRGLFALIWTLLAMVVQGPLLLLPGRGKVGFARVYWTVMCRVIGLRVRVLGAPPRPGGRPVVFVSNHSSWLDILVLGGRLEACFVSKDEVKGWPIINAVARLGRTVYVRRRRASTGRERDDMRQRLAGGDNLILFPEGTTSDGSRVLPFRSAFLSIAELPAGTDGRPPLVQPVSVVYDRLGFLPTGRASRPLFAWYGDMSIGGHFWQLAQHRGLRATVLLHRPLDPAHFASRKALSQAAWRMVADGAATLRQNRPAQPGSPQENAASGAGSGGDGSAIEAISPDRPAFA